MTTAGVRANALRTVVLTGLLVWPVLPGIPYDFVNSAVLACEYLIVALSLVLLVGFVGQISLCQAALVGMGAFVVALTTNHLNVHFPFTLPIGMAAGAFTAILIGVVALRVRGLYLAVATLIFGYLCDQYLFAQTWLVGSRSGTSIPFEVIGRANTIPSFDLADAHIYYFVALAVAVLALYGVANLKESRLGRAFAAVRGSEVAAASLGINVVRTKLVGFACAGALAGLGGTMILVGSRSVAPDQFDFLNSLYFLSIAVVGGLRSIGGAISASILFALLVGELFFRSPTLADYRDVISAVLLLSVLLFFRGGLGAIPQRLPAVSARVRDWWEPVAHWMNARRKVEPALHPVSTVSSGGGRWWTALRHAPAVGRLHKLASAVDRRRRPEARRATDRREGPIDVVALAAEISPGEPAQGPPVLHVERLDDEGDGVSARRAAQLTLHDRIAGEPGPDGRRLPVLLDARNITVRFGGLVAVNDASLHVGAGEIVGLIGPNGAGKTTLFNSILGLNRPTKGRVSLFGRDVTAMEVHARAALGVGRTFQILQLFPDLTVFENLLVATHLQNRTSLWGSVVVSQRARKAEAQATERIQAVLRLMELDEVADRKVAGLPFGVLRLVEVARTLAAGARLVCFDEPASGLDSTETERLLEWFRFLRRIGITLLVIEHDVSFVARLCDHIYVLDQGRLLASGTPAQIQRDPAVIASYLGTAVEVA